MKIYLENCMISNIFVSLYVFPGPAVGTDGQRQAVKSIECSKNNQDISLDSVLLVLLDVLLFMCSFVKSCTQLED